MAKLLLHYLQGTRNTGITYTACNESIIGYSDASWNETNTGRSRSAYIFMMSRGAVSRKSVRQQVVALSTCEAEYIALTEAMKEEAMLKNFLSELSLKKYGTDKLTMKCDNQSAIKLTENPVQHQRSKHINFKYLYI